VSLRPVRSTESASGRVKPERRLVSRETARLLPIVVPVALSGFAVLAFAIGRFAASNPQPEVLAGVFALLLAATFVEAHPVPIEGISSEGISLAAVFIVGTAVIYGWEPAVVMGFLTRALIELFQRRPAIRLSYNSAVYSLGGGAAGFAGGLGGGCCCCGCCWARATPAIATSARRTTRPLMRPAAPGPRSAVAGRRGWL